MTMQMTDRGQTRRVLGIVAVVTVLVIVVAVGVFVVVVRSDPVTISRRTTSDADYCDLAKMIPFVHVVEGLNSRPQDLDVALWALPNHGPDPVNDDVAKVRSQLAAGDDAGALATAHVLDAQTATLCP